MIPSNDDRRAEFAACHHLVKGPAHAVTVTQPKPADPTRHSLERDSFLRHVQPLMQLRIVGNQLFDFGIRAVNVLGISRQGCPAERANPPAEEGSNIGRNEAGIVEGIGNAGFLCHLADVIAIVHHRYAPVPKVEHGFDLNGHGGFRGLRNGFGISASSICPFLHRPARGHIAVLRIVGRGLICHSIRLIARIRSGTLDQVGIDLGGIA